MVGPGGAINSENVFVYGSLIRERSANGEGKLNIPTRVAGLKRGWYVPVLEDRNTGLGVILDNNSCCNGVLVNANEEYLSKTDTRETIHDYRRVELPRGSVESQDAVDKIWVYVIDNPTLPTLDCPIAQSYLDVVLTGCLEVGEDFAEDFVLTTCGWEASWINDRDQPRYRRFVPGDAGRIDNLLGRLIPNQLSNRFKPAR